jgi:hypothetical protein
MSRYDPEPVHREAMFAVSAAGLAEMSDELARLRALADLVCAAHETAQARRGAPMNDSVSWAAYMAARDALDAAAAAEVARRTSTAEVAS